MGAEDCILLLYTVFKLEKILKASLFGVLKSTSQPGLELILVKQQLNKTKSLTHVLLHNNLQIIHRFCS